MKHKPLPVLHINNFTDDQTQSAGFYVQLFEEHIAQYEFVKAPHRHDFYLISLFTQGSGIHTIDFVSYDIKPGSIFFMSPAQVHTWEFTSEPNGYIIFFNPQFYLIDYSQKKLFDFPYFHSITHAPFMYLAQATLRPTEDLFVRIYEEFLSNGYRKEEVIRSYLNILLIKLTGLYHIQDDRKLSSHLAQQVRKLEMLVEQNYLLHKSVNEYAHIMALSTKQLYAICQIALEKSMHEIIGERLLLEAKRLLVHTDLSIARIADQLNFNDHSYFNRFFKKGVNLTPEQFRRQFE